MKILLEEDLKADALLIKKYLEEGGLKYEVTMVTSKTELRKALAETEFDIIVADHSSPGMEALKMVRKKDTDIPFILVSETDSEQAAIDMVLHKDADDYILIDHLNRLPIAVSKAVERRKLKHAKELCEDKLEEKSLHLLRYLN